jgi:hypothetical protein
MFKIAFHGGFSNVWSGVMSIPEVSFLNNLNRVGTGLSYRPARLHTLEELIIGLLKSLKIMARLLYTIK